MSEAGAFEWTTAWASIVGKIRGLTLKSFDSIPSTNTEAKLDTTLAPIAFGEAVGPITLTLARLQTAGRGRSTNAWSSSPGALASSWSARLKKPPQPILSPLIGLALYQSLDRAFPGLPLSLKAPNDVYLGDKKLAGILIENTIAGHEVICVVGVGVNVLTQPNDVATSTCLADYISKDDLSKLYPRFLEFWFSELRLALASGQSEAIEHSARSALTVALNRNPLLSEPIVEIDERGQLRDSKRTWYWHEL